MQIKIRRLLIVFDDHLLLWITKIF